MCLFVCLSTYLSVAELTQAKPNKQMYSGEREKVILQIMEFVATTFQRRKYSFTFNNNYVSEKVANNIISVHAYSSNSIHSDFLGTQQGSLSLCKV